MIHYLAQFQQSEFTTSSDILVLVYFPCPRLSERMRGKVIYFHLVANPYLLQRPIHPLDTDYAAIAIKEAGLVIVLDFQCFVAVPYMGYETPKISPILNPAKQPKPISKDIR